MSVYALGVGKSTSTFHPARAAARAGRPVLLVDLNRHGNLTAEEVREHQPRVGDVVSTRAEETARDAIVQASWCPP